MACRRSIAATIASVHAFLLLGVVCLSVSIGREKEEIKR